MLYKILYYILYYNLIVYSLDTSLRSYLAFLFQFFIFIKKGAISMANKSKKIEKEAKNNASFFKDRRVSKDFWFSKEGIALIAGWTRKGHTVAHIAKLMGVSKATLYNWRNENLDILDALQKNLEICNEMVISALFKKCLDGDVKAQVYWLENRAGKDWRSKQEIAVEGDLPVILVDNVKK